MKNKLKGIFIGMAAVVGLAIGGAALAGAAGGGDDDGSDKAITGSALNRASAAALEHTNGGKVTETEVGDEEGAYEVEVTRDGGGEVDVHLDSDFNVLGTEDESADEEGESDDR